MALALRREQGRRRGLACHQARIPEPHRYLLQQMARRQNTKVHLIIGVAIEILVAKYRLGETRAPKAARHGRPGIARIVYVNQAASVMVETWDEMTCYSAEMKVPPADLVREAIIDFLRIAGLAGDEGC